MEAALAVAIETEKVNAEREKRNAERRRSMMQQQQPSKERKPPDSNPKRAKKKDGFERVSYADVKEQEEAEGYLSEESN